MTVETPAGAEPGGAVAVAQQRRPGWAWGLVLVAPAFAFFAIWNIIPLLWMLGLSFYRYTLTFGLAPVFTGLSNYARVVESFRMWQNFGLTFIFMVAVVGTETLLGVLLGFAFWNSQRLPGRRLALTFIFSPMILTSVAAGTYFKLIYDPTFGVLPYYLHTWFGISTNLLGSAGTALVAVMAVDVWMWTPFMLLMTLAALGSVPKAALEAAAVDRLGFWQRLRYVIWPYGKFILVLGILLRTIDAFKTFGLIAAMTQGGPGNATELISMTLYRSAFNDFSMGRASALAIITLLIAVAFTSLYLRVLKNRTQGV